MQKMRGNNIRVAAVLSEHAGCAERIILWEDIHRNHSMTKYFSFSCLPKLIK